MKDYEEGYKHEMRGKANVARLLDIGEDRGLKIQPDPSKIKRIKPLCKFCDQYQVERTEFNERIHMK